jgi:hypothetical protein
VATSGAQIAGSAAAQDAARDWEAVRAASDIQYAPLPPFKPPAPREPPAWLKGLGEWLNSLFGPIGRFFRGIFEPIAQALGMSWPLFQWLLIGLMALGVLLLLWRIVAPLLERRQKKAEAQPEPEWAPDRGVAIALLDEADRLAAEGRFGEATHLLLRRSVHQISQARPDWLRPASTAREIASLPQLPHLARNAFAVIATRVERSIFALRELNADDWIAARDAYAEFALQKFQESGLAA